MTVAAYGISAPLGSGSYNGLNWGPGTKVHIAAITGAADLPGIRASDSLRAFQHGHFRGVDLAAGRVVDITFAVVGDNNTDCMNILGQIETATVLIEQNENPMLLYNGTRLINCRPRKRAIKYDAGQLQRTATVDVEFVSSSALVFDANLTTVAIPVAVSAGGLSFPVAFPLLFGSTGTSGLVTVTNNGSFATKPIVNIAGPVDNPQLQNLSTGQLVQFLTSLASTDVLTVDFDMHSVVLNGVASRRGTMTPASQWWELPPGQTQVLYSANTSQVGSVATMTFRSAWL